MSEKNQLYDRRTVMRATAGTAAALGFAGTASATSHDFKPGDCVVVDGSAASYTQCDGYLSYPVDDGTVGKVKQECKSDPDQYYVAWDDSNADDGWVNGDSLDPC